MGASFAQEVLSPALFSVLLFTGTIGNILVCLVVLRNKSMRTPMNYLLVNLAISDLVLLLFFSPIFVFESSFTHPGGSTGDVLCALITGESLAWTGGYASAFSLMAIAVERYYAVNKPAHIKQLFTMKRLKYIVAVCWLVALGWNSAGFAVKRFDNTNMGCTMKWPDRLSFKLYSASCFIVFGLIPAFVMGFLYFKIVSTLWFNKGIVKTRSNDTLRHFQRRKATRMAIIVSSVYALTWIPELTIFILIAYNPRLIGDVTTAYHFTVAMVMMNSTLNPLIYTLHGQRFRYYLKKLLRC